MFRIKKSLFYRLFSLILVFALLSPIPAQAAVSEPVQPYASYYLREYSAYVYPAGSGDIQVYFEAHGVSILDELGCLSVSIYESTDNINWTWVKTFTHDSTSGMLGYNIYSHFGHVDYQGVAGRYYKAYVTIWGGDNGDGDSRSFWTSVKKAT